MKDTLRTTGRVVVIAQIGSQVASLGILAALYRLLGPEPYGLLGMILPLLLLHRILIVSGLDVAAIQRGDLSEEQVSALFWVNQGLGLVSAVVIVASVPLLGWFYSTDRLDGPIVALAGTSILIAATTQHQALLQRHMRLGTLAVTRLIALGCGGISAIMTAIAGWGIWALVSQQYVELIVLTVAVWGLEPWRPRRVLRGTGARRLLRFGRNYSISSLMFFLVSNIDKILIGYALGPVALGLYGQAFHLMMKPVHTVLTPLTSIMLPALARVAEHPRRYVDMTLGFFRFIALVMMPAGIGLALVAPEAVRVLGGEKWSPVGPVLSVLATAILVQGFFNALGSVFASAGRADRLAKASVAIALVLSLAFFVGLRWGQSLNRPILGVAMSYSITMLFVVFPPYLVYALRTIGVSTRAFLRELSPAVPAALMMGLVVATVHFSMAWLGDGILLTLEISLGVLVYTILVRREIVRVFRAGFASNV